MKRWIKWLVCFAGGVILLFGLAILVEHLRGERALKARLNDLAGKGERLSLGALLLKHPPPDKNLFLELLPLTNRLATFVTNLEFAPPLLRFAAPGWAIAVAQLNEWSAERSVKGDWKMVASALEPAGEILTALKQAVQKPHYDSGFNYEKGFVDFQLRPIGELLHACKLLSWFVLQDLKGGKDLQYRLHQGDKDFVLYSVGEDGKDEGGNPMPHKEKESYRQIWNGRDAVWPSAATAAEAKAALGTSNPK